MHQSLLKLFDIVAKNRCNLEIRIDNPTVDDPSTFYAVLTLTKHIPGKGGSRSCQMVSLNSLGKMSDADLYLECVVNEFIAKLNGEVYIPGISDKYF